MGPRAATPSYYARRTKRIALSTGVSLLPRHDPIRVAAKIARMEILFDKRCQLGPVRDAGNMTVKASVSSRAKPVAGALHAPSVAGYRADIIPSGSFFCLQIDVYESIGIQPLVASSTTQDNGTG